ncbi:MAG: hypothetical protein K9K66_19320 [Desulfarculaceae bacterium]|nr:hypothetical protein [Desulfarculaceae bacterium]MCF8074534.1 hypothetical protein [Desulfarculaceae bacterium]MCF8103808.1 hypothetical protein [Desulfarculaceae bacterium]MCF8117816.1 hypothetical protein [Desulfarculaceae bacterium]
MKHVLFIVAFAVCLLMAPAAHAYAIYNDMGEGLCIQTPFYKDMGGCKYWIDAHSHHNGAHGSGFNNVYFKWWTGNSCHRNTVPADIPKGGYAKVYKGTAKVYHHNGREEGGYPLEKYKCAK